MYILLRPTVVKSMRAIIYIYKISSNKRWMVLGINNQRMY